MEITPGQVATIEHRRPRQRRQVSLSHLLGSTRSTMWPSLAASDADCPKRFGNWHATYTRMNRWTRARELDGLFGGLQRSRVVPIKIDPEHQGPARRQRGHQKDTSPQSIGKSRGRMEPHDATDSRRLLSGLGPISRPVHLLMDRADEDHETGKLARNRPRG